MAQESAAIAATFRPVKMLVADDHATVRKMVTSTLKELPIQRTKLQVGHAFTDDRSALIIHQRLYPGRGQNEFDRETWRRPQGLFC
jgi:hypothetical protein